MQAPAELYTCLSSINKEIFYWSARQHGCIFFLIPIALEIRILGFYLGLGKDKDSVKEYMCTTPMLNHSHLHSVYIGVKCNWCIAWTIEPLVQPPPPKTTVTDEQNIWSYNKIVRGSHLTADSFDERNIPVHPSPALLVFSLQNLWNMLNIWGWTYIQHSTPVASIPIQYTMLYNIWHFYFHWL